ncbi:hypothetical protein LCM00_19275 [Bacillus infantis]|uniref:hypothetical protein n=1 Tax=Bacillus infantis TaxID=324767 RepID=UPI001CD52923|nr:hypothetical protein [Bacillus infantis]MCA1041662.1 hypothetical protein [Bacillus infantis]
MIYKHWSKSDWMLERLKEELLYANLGLLFMKMVAFTRQNEDGKALLADFTEVIQDIIEQQVKEREAVSTREHESLPEAHILAFLKSCRK